jgi:hypothetical protein
MGPCIVNVFLSMTNKMQHCIILFIIVNALHVLSGFSTHQELKSVHAANKIDKYLMLHVQIWAPDNVWKTHSKHVERWQ